MLCSGSHHAINCGCAKLRALYGSHTYGCSRPGCVRFRNGFESSEERDKHVQAHYRPFKCDFIDCPYYDLGFVSTSLLENHVSKFHNSRAQTSPLKNDSFSQLVEVKAIVDDAIDLDDLNLVRNLHASVRVHGAYFIKSCLLRGSSPDMLHLILRICDDGRLILRWSWYIDWLQGKSNGEPELFRILMERDLIKVGTFDDIVNSCSPEMFELFADYGAEVLDYRRLFRKLLPAQPNAQAEVNSLKCLRAMGNALDIRGYETCLLVLSDRSCSISIARFCLENGASAKAMLACGNAASPLQRAEQKATPEAAQLAELLREHTASSR